MAHWDLQRADNLLQAGLLLRLSEQGRARDYYQEVVERTDVNGDKLDAFSLGIFDALLRAHGASVDTLPLLLYLLKLSEHGPGAATVDAAYHALSHGESSAMRRYVDLGRCTAVQVLDGGPPRPGGYAELLMGELTHI